MNHSNNTTNAVNNLTYTFITEIFAIKDYVVMALYVPIFIVALTANLIVIVIVLKNHYMRRISNYFLVNLAVADLLVTLVCMPNAMWRAYTTIFNFGKYTCKISAYIECVSVGASIFTITVMAMHRYFAITRPLFGHLYRTFNRCGIIVCIMSLWTSSLFVFSPILWVYDQKFDTFPTVDENITIYLCEEDWTNIIIPQHLMGIIWFTFVFAIPGTIMAIAYSTMGKTLCSETPLFADDSTCSYQRKRLIRSRKKVACILLLLAFVFAVCWLPKHIMNLMDDTQIFEMDETSTIYNLKQAQIKRYLLLLGHLNSALNPVIYCALSKRFRNSIQNLFCGRSCVTHREVTGVTLIKLNTLRHQQQNSPTVTPKTSRKFEELDDDEPSYH